MKRLEPGFEPDEDVVRAMIQDQEMRVVETIKTGKTHPDLVQSREEIIRIFMDLLRLPGAENVIGLADRKEV